MANPKNIVKIPNKKTIQSQMHLVKAGQIPDATHSFKSWWHELRKVHKVRLDKIRAQMYYMGGYSPKMVRCEELRIPQGWESV